MLPATAEKLLGAKVRHGWLDAEWGISELGRRAKFYRLSRAGRQQLASDTAAWAAFSTAVNRVLVKV